MEIQFLSILIEKGRIFVAKNDNEFNIKKLPLILLSVHEMFIDSNHDDRHYNSADQTLKNHNFFQKSTICGTFCKTFCD